MAKAKKTPSGKWRVLIYVGKVNGKRRYKSFTADTKSGAEYSALVWKQSQPTVSDLTLRQAYYSYINDRNAVLSPSTLREYERVARTSDSPLMSRRIADIRQNEVQKEVNRLSANHSPKTVRNRYGLFTAVMSVYRPEVHFSVKLPQKKKADVYIPDEDAVIRLYELLQNEERWLLVAFLLASQCGLRASEIAGLTYDHIDYQNRRIRVCQALVRGKDGHFLKPPKSVSGDRWIPCSAELLEVIGTGDLTEPVVPKTATRIANQWYFFIKKSGEEYFSFHKLRHFFCSRALLAGIPKRYVADYMGHASEDMVNKVYEHVFPSAREKFADLLTQTAVFSTNATQNATRELRDPHK